MNPRKSVPDFAWSEHLATLHRLADMHRFRFNCQLEVTVWLAVKNDTYGAEHYWKLLWEGRSFIETSKGLDDMLALLPRLELLEALP